MKCVYGLYICSLSTLSKAAHQEEKKGNKNPNYYRVEWINSWVVKKRMVIFTSNSIENIAFLFLKNIFIFSSFIEMQMPE